MTEITTAPEDKNPSIFTFLRRRNPQPTTKPSEQETTVPDMTRAQLLEKFREAGLVEEAEALETVSTKFEALATMHGYRGSLHVAGGSVTKALPRKDIDIVVTLENMREGKGNSRYERNSDRLRQLFVPFINEISPTGFRITTTNDPRIDDHSNNPDHLAADGSTLLVKEGVAPLQFIDNTTGTAVSYPGQPIVLMAQTTNG